MVDLILAFVVPPIIIISLFLLSIVVRFITYHAVDPRKIIPTLLPGVTIKSQSGRSYWCIADTFYFFMDIESQYYRKNLKTEQTRLHERLTIRQTDVQQDRTIEESNHSNDDSTITSSKQKKSDDQKSIELKCIPKPSVPRGRSLKHAYQEKESLATWLIYGMLAIVFMITVAYYVNSAVTYERTVTFCSELTNQERVNSYCYPSFNRLPINMTGCEAVDYGILYCFVVIDVFEVQNIGELANAVVLFYITAVVMSIIFQAVKFLHHFYSTNLWSIAIIIIGTAILLTSLSLLILIFVMDFHFDALFIFKVVSISFNIILVGVLLLIGVPLEEAEEDEDSQEDEIEGALKEMFQEEEEEIESALK